MPYNPYILFASITFIILGFICFIIREIIKRYGPFPFLPLSYKIEVRINENNVKCYTVVYKQIFIWFVDYNYVDMPDGKSRLLPMSFNTLQTAKNYVKYQYEYFADRNKCLKEISQNILNRFNQKIIEYIKKLWNIKK